MSRILVIAVLTEISMFNNPKYAASHYAISDHKEFTSFWQWLICHVLHFAR